LANHYADPWWHEVIVLAAGIQGADAGRLVNELLGKEEPAATFLAAQCLETAVQIPLDVRDKIEQRLRKFVPPKTENDAEKLKELGVVVAPALTKALSEKLSLEETGNILLALIGIDYEPAIGAIARYIMDHRLSDTEGETLQATAMGALAIKSWSSKLAKATFLTLVPRIQPAVAKLVAHGLKQVIEVLRGEVLERECSTLQELLDALPAEAKKD
jgi:hypothetical protein